ncbi:hypothetical protein MMC10_011190 [Thelotrema lepadinum]|nr:hypothetical protein [Thelotrema lepadinum]
MSVRDRIKLLEQLTTVRPELQISSSSVSAFDPLVELENHDRIDPSRSPPGQDDPESRPPVPTRKIVSSVGLAQDPAPTLLVFKLSPVTSEVSHGSNTENQIFHLQQELNDVNQGSRPPLPHRPNTEDQSPSKTRKTPDRPPPPKPVKSSTAIDKYNALYGEKPQSLKVSGFTKTVRICSGNSTTGIGVEPPVLIESRSSMFMKVMTPNAENVTASEAPGAGDETRKESSEVVHLQISSLKSNVVENNEQSNASSLTSPEDSFSIGRKISDKFTETRKGLERASQATKPALEGLEKGFKIIGRGVKDTFSQIEVPRVFLHTSEDFNDAAAKLKGTEDLCSRCRTIPIENFVLGRPETTVNQNLEWASPLSRMIYHADWCRVCKFLLDQICEPENDPLKHPAIADFVQPELSGLSMREWADRGWQWTDANWPFGHSSKRHEGATYVLGPTGQVLWTVAQRLGAFGAYFALHRTMAPKRRARDITKGFTDRAKTNDSGKSPKYPLSCVVKISANTALTSKYPGMVLLSVFGYGRGAAATIQVLSELRLRVLSHSEADGADSLEVPRSLNSPGYWRLLDPHWIDPAVGKLWLRECAENHGKNCSDHGWDIILQKLKFLRVIDVKDLCIREIAKPADCLFIALSYVWGAWSGIVKLEKANKEVLMKKGGLTQYLRHLPQTIIDALEVVAGMGERYLWTDALCIVQDDPVEMAEQIGNMDRIYDSSLATIIAAQGATADSGLEGIRQRYLPASGQRTGMQRYLYQNSVGVKDNTLLAAPLKTNSHDIEESTWNSRAWTFQERLLSRRLIIFTHGQVLWQCRQAMCREDMPIEMSGIPCPQLRFSQLTRQAVGENRNRNWMDGSIEISRHGETKLVRSATFAEYTKSIEQYTHRQLSFQSDILNAFAGLGQIFATCFQCRPFFGLPEALLDLALFWRPTRQLKRRNEFPSWSWAGWIGQVAYNSPFKICRTIEGHFESYQEDQFGGEGLRPLIRWHSWEPSANRIIPLNGTGLGFPHEAGKQLPAEWENGPYNFDSRGDGAPRRAPEVPIRIDSFGISESIASQCLFFWASTSSNFHLGAAIRNPGDQAWVTRNTPIRHVLWDQDTFPVGNILFDGTYNRPPDIRSDAYELVQIAEAQYLGLANEYRDIEDFPLYAVMVIQWDEARKVARRVGTGKVHKTAWMLAAPELKLIALA